LPKNNPLRVGITGGIGSGKSIVAKVFSVLGVPVFNSDLVAKQILASNAEVMTSVKEYFGDQAYLENGPNREFLAQVVFDDPAKREKLNSIIHPQVGRAFERFCGANESADYVLKEAAIMVESGAHEHLDLLILVTAPEELRMQRILSRDKTNRKAIEGRMSAQLTDEQKRPYASFEIKNNGKNPVIPKVLQIHNTILRSA